MSSDAISTPRRVIDRGKLEVRRVARIAIEDFADEEVARVYLAARLAEALLVEVELNKQDVDYAVEVESYLAAAVFWLSDIEARRFMCMRHRRTFVVEYCVRRE